MTDESSKLNLNVLAARVLEDQLDEFLVRAVACRSWADMMRLAREYVELDDHSLV